VTIHGEVGAVGIGVAPAERLEHDGRRAHLLDGGGGSLAFVSHARHNARVEDPLHRCPSGYLALIWDDRNSSSLEDKHVVPPPDLFCGHCACPGDWTRHPRWLVAVTKGADGNSALPCGVNRKHEAGFLTRSPLREATRWAKCQRRGAAA